jgi:E3 ubiquitin-protein ligase UBR7
MLMCHEGHEVDELYSKLDFRCDCGNSKFPRSCELFNEKDYENNQNFYNQTFYNLYCHCRLPHNQEMINEEKTYMLQCFECEDWYHNTHLFPKENSTNIEANWLLICRLCLRKEGYKEAMMEYKDSFYP